MADVKFKIPKGFTPPDGSEAKDGKFDIVCTFEVEGDSLCLTKLGNFDMDYDKDKKDKKETDERPSYRDAAQNMVGAMQQGMGGGGVGGGY